MRNIVCGHCNKSLPLDQYGQARDCPDAECIYKEEQFVLKRRHERIAGFIDAAWDKNRGK